LNQVGRGRLLALSSHTTREEWLDALHELSTYDGDDTESFDDNSSDYSYSGVVHSADEVSWLQLNTVLDVFRIADNIIFCIEYVHMHK
jgi:hypothetical protein